MELLSVFTSPPLFRVVERPEGTWLRPRIDVLQEGRGPGDPGAGRSKLEDEPPGLETPHCPR